MTRMDWIMAAAVGAALMMPLTSAVAQTATDLNCIQCVSTPALVPQAVTAPKLAERAVREFHFGAGQVSKRALAPGSVVTGKIGANAVNGDKIADLVRTLSFPARVLSYPPGGTIITEHVRGLNWQSNLNAQGFLTLQKPADYAGGDVQVTVLFQTSTSVDGDVDFFIKPRSFSTPGDLVPAADVTTLPVTVSAASGSLYEQTFAIPAATLVGNWWLISFQRGGVGSTYTNDVQVRAVSLDYTATQ